MKSLAKKIIASILGRQVRKLCDNHDFTIVAVAGSVGKTSTKLAIAKLLSESKKVQFQDGNYNDLVSVPLIFFGLSMPSVMNPFGWLKTIMNINKQLKEESYPYDIVVLELGTDHPGQIAQFQKYLKVNIAVLSAIAPEHMEYFENIDNVAKEELAIKNYSEKLIVNSDSVSKKYLKDLEYLSYGSDSKSTFYLKEFTWEESKLGYKVEIQTPKTTYKSFAPVVGQHQLQIILSAVAVAESLGLGKKVIEQGIKKLYPAPGRMQILDGINNSLIIDDSYNSSPVAVKAALDVLYNLSGSQKIAILGNMNELGEGSENYHRDIGNYCDPEKLNVVITIGPDANQYIYEQAQKMGCNVRAFNSPYEIGEYLSDKIKPDARILVKGSQNGVFAEEAIKSLLAKPKDETKLVRQSPSWLKIKHKQFR